MQIWKRKYDIPKLTVSSCCWWLQNFKKNQKIVLMRLGHKKDTLNFRPFLLHFLDFIQVLSTIVKNTRREPILPVVYLHLYIRVSVCQSQNVQDRPKGLCGDHRSQRYQPKSQNRFKVHIDDTYSKPKFPNNYVVAIESLSQKGRQNRV